MTLLTVWPEQGPDAVLLRTEDPTEIRRVLAELGVRFDRWEVVPGLPEEPTSAQVLAAYRDQIEEVISTEGYVHVDAMHMTPTDTPDWRRRAEEARARFRSEHTHDDDEDRFFARGSGVFYLHVGHRVHAVLCEAGDLLSVPANTTHWFDMGTTPDYVSIRFFHDEQGWVGDFVPNSIADRFPGLDEIRATLG
ncbi:cupin [Actinoalloteichus sp. AHMU CJ021]|uniref:Acireductone dioxygenase n=1 Tax=Actinoalloteichus caeruleus DSM 43889 TaxID=1120930 RepID=A0ABT1JDD5_ACTCY|nr:cupin [Actinoalloteichus caeruleus]AUS81037.1 cupin [Actinoalloteichus sp. AHMU CJ021]MCP2330512.1 1,2-dihydroxy-3-keto-5-methylthiopentene dioxygenase [Actinoalloteichus caeruleus DSM 43889]